LNSDDFVYRDTYARLVSRGETAGADVVYGNVDFVDADGRFLYSLQAARPGALRQLFGAFLFGFMPHAAVFRRRTFDALGGFDESFRHIADMDLFARACCAGQRFASVPYPSVAVFRIHADQLSRRERNVVRHELVQLQTRLGRKSRLAGGWAILEWKARNIRQYLARIESVGDLFISDSEPSCGWRGAPARIQHPEGTLPPLLVTSEGDGVHLGGCTAVGYRRGVTLAAQVRCSG